MLSAPAGSITNQLPSTGEFMTFQHRVDEIAREAVHATGRYRLRKPSEVEIERMEAACISQISALYELNFAHAELGAYAATATYRAIVAEEDARRLTDQLSEMVAYLELAETASMGGAEEARAALTKLAGMRNAIMSTAVMKYGRAIALKQKASAGGKKRQEKGALVKAFAIEKYEKGGTWKTTRQASFALWSEVENEAKRVGRPMTTTQGPTTIYGWLLRHKNSTRSAS
jgi:hypothetical protein